MNRRQWSRLPRSRRDSHFCQIVAPHHRGQMGVLVRNRLVSVEPAPGRYRRMLYEAAQSMLRSKKWSWLKAWAMQIARRRGMKKAIVALARRLAVIMHRIWVDGTEFRWTREQATAAA